MQVNCGSHPNFCRKRQLKHFPWIELYIAEDAEASFENKMRTRLMHSDGKHTVCPYRGDFSAQGIKTMLEELDIIPRRDYFQAPKTRFYIQLVESLLEVKESIN